MLIDIAIFLIFAFSLYRGWRRGFLYGLGSLLLLIVAFVLAMSCSTLLSSWIYRQADARGVLAQLETRLSPMMAGAVAGTGLGAQVGSAGILAKLSLPPAFYAILEKYGLKIEALGNYAEEAGRQGKELLQQSVHSLASSLMQLFLQALSFFLIFLLSFLILRFILKLLSAGINKLPLFGSVNRLLGMALSFVFALIVVGTLLSLLPVLWGSWPELKQYSEGSRLSRLILNSGVYAELLRLFYR